MCPAERLHEGPAAPPAQAPEVVTTAVTARRAAVPQSSAPEAATVTTAVTTAPRRGRHAPGSKTKWQGGFVRFDARGRPTYWVQKRLDGKRWHFSLHVHTETGANDQLRAFESDPAGYMATRGRDDRLRFDEKLRDSFIEWSTTERRNSQKWIADQRRYLAWWAEKLGDADLRALDLGRDIMPALDGTACRAPKIAVIKSLYSWLRSVRHTLETRHDPTFGRLKMPQSSPEQWCHTKTFTTDDLAKILPHLESRWLAAVEVQRATGWHFSETRRFAQAGRIEQPTAKEPILVRIAKSREPERTRVSRRAASFAAELLKAGTLNYKNYRAALRRACAEAGLKALPVKPGNFRHSVATAAIEVGKEDLKAVSDFLGHKSPRTTKKFYATHSTPRKIKITL